MSAFDYSKKDIASAFRETGIREGASVFTHSNVGFFGKLEGAKIPQDYYDAFKKEMLGVIGEQGTWVMPTFTYSFCWGHEFDIDNTPSTCGLLSEMMRKDSDAARSGDANFSVAAIGKHAEYFTENAPAYSFGPNSFWERFLEKKGVFCNFNFDSASTFIHYAERFLKVPYRYDKPFEGVWKKGDKEEKKVFYHFVYDLQKPYHAPDFKKFDARAKEWGFVREVRLGKGQMLCISAEHALQTIQRGLQEDPSFLTKGS
ncbi:MAG: AAC(3) family N-acetyltransferase [Candidatus Wildermuthbacteria bacterium]|nr:AAC(3) family N-acetyltransferase [Candidatus Wildermuthbacteria bacterium]